jgi:NUMOD3 motif
MQFYTYLWLREDGTPYYVGKGSGKRAWDSQMRHRPPRNKAMIIVQCWPDEDTAFAYERYQIDFWGRKDLGTGVLINHTDGGENPPVTFSKPWLKGRSPSLETRAKLSAALLGIKRSKETRAKLSRVMTGNKNGNTPSSAEKKAKISATLKGHTVSVEIREKISNTLKGRAPKKETSLCCQRYH